MITNSNIEMLIWEIGKTYKVKKTFILSFDGKNLTIPEGFEHDKYTFAPNLPDPIPAIGHDRALTHGKWDDGTIIYVCQADLMLKQLMINSPSAITRMCASLYYRWVRIFHTLCR